MKLTNEEIQKIEKLLRDSSYVKYHKHLQIIYFRSKEKSYKEIMDLLDDNKTTVWRNLKKYKKKAFAFFLGSIIFVVGKSPMDIMEPIFV